MSVQKLIPVGSTSPTNVLTLICFCFDQTFTVDPSVVSGSLNDTLNPDSDSVKLKLCEETDRTWFYDFISIEKSENLKHKESIKTQRSYSDTT